MFTTTTWAIIGGVLSAYEICRFLFWLDGTSRR